MSESKKERRESLRHTLNGRAACYVCPAGDRVIGPFEVRDISAGGIRLALPAKIPLPDIIQLRLFHRKWRTWLEYQATVVFASRPSGGEFILGGQFARPLGDKELEGFLEKETASGKPARARSAQKARKPKTPVRRMEKRAKPGRDLPSTLPGPFQSY
ncbi:MAG: PilZ domain-containing protein [Planctomycetes bacterium]|nr:PilZ domain-containing protein [Planctomycetota bacterium]